MNSFSRLLLFMIMVLVPNLAKADQVSGASNNVFRVISITENYGQQSIATGSGFAISSNRIVTNAHVVESVYNATGRAGVRIVLQKDRRLRVAQILGYNRAKDLALLEVEDVDFQPLKLFNGALNEGSKVIALGYPANRDQLNDAQFYEPQPPMRSAGTFSNIASVGSKETLDHDAGIAHGNSGGPLVDDCGRVVGVNTHVTTNDRGDASFGSAVSINELSAFLSSEGQKFTTVDGECVPPELAASRLEAEKAKAALGAERLKAQQDRDRDREAAALSQRQQMETQASRENFMAGAALALVLAGIAAAYGLSQKGKEEPNHFTKASTAAVILLLIAIAAFLARPSLTTANSAAPSTQETAPSPDGAVDENADRQTPSDSDVASVNAEQSDYICSIDEGRSRYSETLPDDVEMTFAPNGCVNGRAQYVRSGNGAWQRVSVLNQENAVTRLSFDPQLATFTREIWRPDDDIMQDARKLRKGYPDRKCVTDPQLIEDQSNVQRSIMKAMIDNPQERMVYQCNKTKG